MSQSTPVIPANQPGLQYRTADNNAHAALNTHHKGSSAPSYAEAGMIWLDDSDTPWKIKIHDGSDWIVIASVNATTNALEAYHGAAPLRMMNHASDTGTANAYAIAPSPVISSYTTGLLVFLKPANASTGACTLAVNGLSAKSIKTLAGANPASGALGTSGIYALIYDGTNFVLLNAETPLADNAVTYAKMQDISATSRIIGRKTAGSGDPEECTLSQVLDMIGSAARGDVLYRGSSTWARLAAGTTGQVLQTNGSGGDPAWGTLVLGSRVYLSTVTANNTSGNLDLALSGSYDMFEIEFEHVAPATDAITANIVFTTDNFSSVQTSNYIRNYRYHRSDNLAGCSGSSSDSQIPLSDSTITFGNATGENASFTLKVFNRVNGYTSITGIGSVIRATGVPDILEFTGQSMAGGSAVNGLRLRASSGNWNSGQVRIYGIKSS